MSLVLPPLAYRTPNAPWLLLQLRPPSGVQVQWNIKAPQL